MERGGWSTASQCPGRCGLVTGSHLPASPLMSPQLRRQASQNGREAWGCPPGTGMLGSLGRTPLEFHCNLCPGTVLTGNQVSLLVPMAEPPSVLPAGPVLLPVASAVRKATLLPRRSSQALTSVLVMFPTSLDCMSHHPRGFISQNPL